jgi:hypothetical protein
MELNVAHVRDKATTAMAISHVSIVRALARIALTAGF